jgi:hypothetical protein
MFDNDHLLIDNELLTMENELIKINDIKSIFYSINSMEDFKKFRTMIGQFISTFENEIELILNSIKNIQYSNRKFYDTYAKLQNDFQDVNSKLEFYYKENNKLYSKLNEEVQHIEFLSNTNQNQEEYINELLQRLRQKEMNYYGIDLTRKNDTISNTIQSNKSISIDGNSSKKINLENEERKRLNETYQNMNERNVNNNQNESNQ